MVWVLQVRLLVREDHLPQQAVHLDQGHHPVPADRISLASHPGQWHQIVPLDVPIATMLQAGGRQGAGVQPQGVARFVEFQGVSQLRVEEADHMGPREKRAALFLHSVLPGQSGHQMVGNKIAELLEKRELCRRWLPLGLIFFIPCLVAGSKPASQPFFNPDPSNLWDGSVLA